MFDTRFETVVANTSESRSIHYNVRYRVFCLERGFEDAEAFETGEETDDWDKHSEHFIVRHRDSGAPIAAYRVILPSAPLLPVEQLGCLEDTLPIPVNRTQVAEVSRVCVMRSNGKGVGASSVSALNRVDAITSKDESEILLGMIRGIIFYCWDNELPHLYMLITSPFARLLQRLGVVYHEAGQGIEHRGTRKPYLIEVNESWTRMRAKSGAVADMFSRQHLAFHSYTDLQRQTPPYFAELPIPKRVNAS